ncbi:MAG: LysM peptidoglycan-binding domain-containing protein [Anaerolineae bacterium]|nr:LysM peptidoglycan-binding domain-containing protein [Anaerolineae bacterium]
MLHSLRKGIYVLLVAALLLMAAVPAFAQAEGVQQLGIGGYGGGWCTQYHTVRPGENLFRIGLLYGVQWTYLQSINYLPNANWIYVGQTLCVRSGSPGYGRTYIVRYGDTLFGIARWYGVNLYTLAAYNGITNVNYIYAGQLLYIP